MLFDLPPDTGNYLRDLPPGNNLAVLDNSATYNTLPVQDQGQHSMSEPEAAALAFLQAQPPVIPSPNIHQPYMWPSYQLWPSAITNPATYPAGFSGQVEQPAPSEEGTNTSTNITEATGRAQEVASDETDEGTGDVEIENGTIVVGQPATRQAGRTHGG